jgi:hypothetical protein
LINIDHWGEVSTMMTTRKVPLTVEPDDVCDRALLHIAAEVAQDHACEREEEAPNGAWTQG